MLPAIEKPETNLAVMPSAEITPMSILQIAVSQGADIDKLAKLLELQERFEANEARKAYNAAMAEFKKSPPVIDKNKHVSYPNSKGGTTEYDHATLDNVCDKITAALSQVGISHRWKIEQAQVGDIAVTCVLTHFLGHSESTTLRAGPDQSGGKNPIQAVSSTVSYLERYTLLGAVGMATKDMDNDGHGATDQEWLSEQITRMEACLTVVDLQKLFAEVYKTADESKDKATAAQIIKARDERKAKIREANPSPGPKVAEPLVLERLDWVENARDIDELKRIYNNALKMAKQAGDVDFEDRLVKASNKRAEAIRANS